LNRKGNIKIGCYLRNIGISGGVKVVLQHARMIQELGYDTVMITKRVEEVAFIPPEVRVEEVKDMADLPACDIYTGTQFRDVKALYETVKAKVIHISHLDERVDYRARLSGESLTDKYRRTGPFSFAERYFDRLKFRKRIREIESVYRLPTIKAAISKHLAQIVEREYGQKCVLIQNGIDPRVFYPDAARPWGEGGRVRILSIGSMHVGFKGIPDTLDAVRTLRKEGRKVELIRVSPTGPAAEERGTALVDRFYTGLDEKSVAALYRESDIFISSSLEGEGFGLPAIEALMSGTPAILTEISSYLNFDERHDFASFVPVHSPEEIARGVAALMDDAGLRQRRIQRGFEVASNFTLEKTKEALGRFLEEVTG